MLFSNPPTAFNGIIFALDQGESKVTESIFQSQGPTLPFAWEIESESHYFLAHYPLWFESNLFVAFRVEEESATTETKDFLQKSGKREKGKGEGAKEYSHTFNL